MEYDMQILMWLFLLLVVAARAEFIEFECLKSIKESLQDPKNLLTSTWRFDNLTEGAICKFTKVNCWHDYENKIMSLDLSNMGLEGSFPRCLGNCPSLTSLNLSHNHLSGSLPSDISSLIGSLVDLDLSNNGISGEIPVSLANCTYLSKVNLDNNRLEGRIPGELGGLSRLRSFSVANNHLSGRVPDFNVASVSIIYTNNSGLCGGPLSPCIEEEHKDVYTIHVVGGFVVGWVVSVLVTLFLCLFCLPNMCSSCLG